MLLLSLDRVAAPLPSPLVRLSGTLTVTDLLPSMLLRDACTRLSSSLSKPLLLPLLRIFVALLPLLLLLLLLLATPGIGQSLSAQLSGCLGHASAASTRSAASR